MPLTIRVLRHLREIERRNLFADRGYSSLFDYCVRELGYSESAAQRRISSMRLMSVLPEIAEKIEKGALSLSTLSLAQSFFRVENIKGKAAKIEVLSVLEGKSRREVHRELAARSKQPERLLPVGVRSVSSTHSQLTFVVEDSMLARIEELRGLMAYSHPGASLQEVLGYSVESTLKRLRPRDPAVSTGKSSARSKVSVPPAAVSTSAKRYVPLEIKRQVWKRDGGECSYVDHKTGRRCRSRYGLQYDHIQPFALGGESSLDNLRLSCLVHNQASAIQIYGLEKMAEHIPRFA